MNLTGQNNYSNLAFSAKNPLQKKPSQEMSIMRCKLTVRQLNKLQGKNRKEIKQATGTEKSFLEARRAVIKYMKEALNTFKNSHKEILTKDLKLKGEKLPPFLH